MFKCGEIAKRHIENIKNFYSYTTIEKYIIMRNHFHFILNITTKNLGLGGLSVSAKPYNYEASKFVSLLKRYCNRKYGRNIWQASYNDHIIRGGEDHQKIRQYIDSNAQKWEQDCFYVK